MNILSNFLKDAVVFFLNLLAVECGVVIKTLQKVEEADAVDASGSSLMDSRRDYKSDDSA